MNGPSDLDKFYHLFPNPGLAHDLTNILEDYRIQACLKKEYPVFAKQLREINAHMLTKRPSSEGLANDKQKVVELIGQLLIFGKTNELISESIAPALEQALSVSQCLSALSTDVHDTAKVATQLYFLIDDTFPEPYEPMQPFSNPLDQSQIDQNVGNFGRTARKIDDKLKSQEQDSLNPQMDADDQDKHDDQNNGNQSIQLDSNIDNLPDGNKDKKALSQRQELQQPSFLDIPQSQSEDGIKQLLKDLFKQRGVKPKEVEAEIDTLRPEEVSAYLSGLETSIKGEEELQDAQDSILYPEWGQDIDDYRLNWARIREQTVYGESNEFYAETMQEYGGLIKRVKQEFKMLRPDRRVSLRRQFDGDDIDLDAAVEYLLDRRMGISPSEMNYIRKVKRERDFAVAFLVDMSESTRGSTIKCEKQALVVMAEALKELGDKFAIYGFSGNTRKTVDFYIIKDFDEAYDRSVQSRISAITDKDENRDGTAIRHATEKLRRRDEKTKMLVFLSDGKPQDKEYHGEYGIEDTKKALKEAKRHGIKLFCVTVDRQAADYLPAMYSNSSWVVIDDIMKLSQKITRVYKQLTT